jgi:hypothetical protein
MLEPYSLPEFSIQPPPFAAKHLRSQDLKILRSISLTIIPKIVLYFLRTKLSE